jgi:acyl carrier protein
MVMGPAVVARIAADADLRRTGLGSGELIRLCLLVEQECDVELTEEDIDGMRTLRDVQLLIDRPRGDRPDPIELAG